MLVIVSDLHLTDGTCDATPSPEMFFLFAERLRELAQRAAWRADGAFRPLEKIDVLLLGDLLDVIRSSHWTTNKVRPWHDPQAAQYTETVETIVKGILTANHTALDLLRKFGAQGLPCISPGGESYRVPVRVHYMVGNHDWPLHLTGAPHDAIRALVVQGMSLANNPRYPFAHDPYESDEILDVLRRHKVFARHGDIYDPLNFAEDRDVSSLGDALNIEVVGRFLQTIQQDLSGDLSSLVLANLHEIDNVRPLPMVPIYIDGLLERACPQPALRKRVKQTWDKLVDEFLALDIVRRRDTWLPFDVVDGLRSVLQFAGRSSQGWSNKVTSWLQSTRGASTDSYYPQALAEQDFRNRRARHIVYGHTHQAEVVPLDASYADGVVLNQLYFNTGTWRRTHRSTMFAPHEHEFIPSESMSVLSFFQADERSGRPFETWTGTLGISPSDAQLLRVDAPQAAVPAPATPVVASSAPATNSPHFATSLLGRISKSIT